MKDVKDWNILAYMLLPALGRAQLAYINAVCKHSALQLNGALRRHRLSHGLYPADLDNLVPDILPKLPPDPFSGEPFKYRREMGGAMLYSVGPDLDDDGGKEAKHYGEDGDIVYQLMMRERR